MILKKKYDELTSKDRRKI